MLIAYINYPNSRFIVHERKDCSAIRQHSKKEQRIVNIEKNNIREELLKFEKYHVFRPNSAFNDMWVNIDLGDPKKEDDTVLRIHQILSQRYSRLKVLSYCGTCSS